MFSDDSLARLPLHELSLSPRAYNCLRRAGVTTIGELCTVLPQGWHAVRNAGPKVWGEIQTALNRYFEARGVAWPVRQVDASSARIDPVPSADLPHERSNTSQASTETEFDLPIEALRLPADMVESLRRRGMTGKQALLSLSIAQVSRVEGLEGLREADWSNLIHSCRVSTLGRTWSKTGPKGGPPLEVLDLPKRAFNCIRRRGITDLEQLAECSLGELLCARGLGAKSIMEILSKMQAYLSSGKAHSEQCRPPQADDEQQSGMAASAATQLRDGLPKVQLLEEQPDTVWGSLAEQISSWLDPLPERHRQVICWRYGLQGGQRQTLEQLGKHFGQSRERMRQIQASAIKRLRRPSPRRILGSLVEGLRHVIARAGGLAAEVELGESLVETLEAGGIDPQGVARLLIDTHDGFHKAKGMQAWGLSESWLELSPEIVRKGAEILAAEHAPLPGSELLRRLKASSWCQVHASQVSDEFILASFRVGRRITCTDDESYALERWQRSYQDDMIVALRRLGKPSHYREIAEAIKATLPPGQHITPKAVHIRLMQHPDLFVWVGRRGTYGLKEWGLKRPLSYEDALAQLLAKAGHPLTFQQILAGLPELRPYYDEASVTLTLGTNRRFRAFPGNSYGLADWREEDFAGDYRVQRVFEAGNVAALRRSKREVLHALRSVDGFIARARGGADGERQ